MKVVTTEVKQEVTKILIKHINLRNLATEGWSAKSKPRFPRFIEKYDQGLRFGVRVQAKNAESASISVYRMLEKKRYGNLATRARRVFLSANYQRKTIPKKFGNFGKGGTIIRTKSGRPVIVKGKGFPGIEAREWDSLANLALEDEMTAAIKKGYRKGFRKVQGK